MAESVFQLKCYCNSYPWGRKGSSSLAARLCANTPGTDFKINENEIYSEMWMGNYPDVPAYVLSTSETLEDHLKAQSHKLIGPAIESRFGHGNLPFLPKIISIAKALPLQIHPNKALAAALHEREPSRFTDPNHKPEIAIALSTFRAFVGFKPCEVIEKLFSDVEPIKVFLPEIKKPKFCDQIVKHIVRQILQASDETIQEVSDELLEVPKEAFGEEPYILELLPELRKQYDKTDPGHLVALLTMNFVELPPGGCICIPADGIHAYLSGDIMEVMARSNNMLATGFCPGPERDRVHTFVSVLSFSPHNADDAMIEPAPFEGSAKTLLYKPPIVEFNVLKTKLEKGESEKIRGLGGPSVLIVIHGGGKLKADGKEHKLDEGYSYFVGYDVETVFEAGTDGLEVFRAYLE
ncbi:mannose-6-phosphate isomeras-like protein [Trichodelitschia bisporula]|uniref:Mannose-6-phosphate isomerase n=1 Tax=Trichodelitschia bisporula TaxID=703511 RepID=A0A6G1I9H6_9PEZI|nr:mannose-6-phosphate isomeras-like protein [Trichodelitschia bisporula]